MVGGNLVGKLAVVTGGSGTIGKAIAGGLLSAGASVVITGRNVDKLRDALTQITKTATAADTSSKPISFISCDVTDERSVEDFFHQVREKHGGCDLLVNNAGTMAPGKTVDLSASEFDWVMKVNVLGPFLCSREAFKQMKEKGGGRIINIGSISAYSPRPDGAAYTTSKAALTGLTKSLAIDGRPFGISVGMIHPGNVRSELLTPEEIARREPLEGFMQPEDVAECIVTMANMPLNTNVLELSVMPTRQPYVGRG